MRANIATFREAQYAGKRHASNATHKKATAANAGPIAEANCLSLRYRRIEGPGRCANVYQTKARPDVIGRGKEGCVSNMKAHH